MDPVTLEIYRHRFSGIALEMGEALKRTALSPNIKERLDFSCALFDSKGCLVAQAAHIPVHLGAMPDSVAVAMIAFGDWAEGDVVLTNDPYQGGTHLPDLTMISPVFLGREHPDFFVASRAHHADVGGMSPGSLPLSTELFQEGLVILPVRLIRAGREVEEIMSLILANVRTPGERRGDLAAQLAAHGVGERRLKQLVERHGLSEVLDYATHLQQYSERLMRASIASWPDGVTRFEDLIELPGGKCAAVRVKTTIKGEHIVFDFSDSADQVASSMNAVISVTRSACYYVVRCLAGDEIPVNQGCIRPVEVIAREGSLVNAARPAAVAAGNVETSQRIVDVLLGSLSLALPDSVPAASQGSMNNLTIGGLLPDGSPFTYYETLGGGTGGGPRKKGLNGVHSHMTNTRNTPVEALEISFPFIITRYQIRRDSGGRGLNPGGDGLVREYEFQSPVTVTLISERRRQAPWGLEGGSSGRVGENRIVHLDGSIEICSSKFTRVLEAGVKLCIETPGGGGWGAESG